MSFKQVKNAFYRSPLRGQLVKAHIIKFTYVDLRCYSGFNLMWKQFFNAKNFNLVSNKYILKY